MVPKKIIICTLAWFTTLSCNSQPDNKKAIKVDKKLEPTTVRVTSSIKEASGIADSKKEKNALWIIEDSGNPAELTLLGYDGKLRKKVPVKGAVNRDWEDVALSNGFIYIADIGDNSQKHKEYRIYRMKEPDANTSEITKVQIIRFRYPDKSHDAEAILVDPDNQDIYIITKRDSLSQVFRLAYPFNFNGVNDVELAGRLSFSGVVSAAIAPDSQEILVKTYGKIYRYTRKAKEPITQALKSVPSTAPYKGEPQGESISYKLDGSGYFTLSEQLLGIPVQLHFYPR